jgi:hypothetical protein
MLYGHRHFISSSSACLLIPSAIKWVWIAPQARVTPSTVFTENTAKWIGVVILDVLVFLGINALGSLLPFGGAGAEFYVFAFLNALGTVVMFRALPPDALGGLLDGVVREVEEKLRDIFENNEGGDVPAGILGAGLVLLVGKKVTVSVAAATGAAITAPVVAGVIIVAAVVGGVIVWYRVSARDRRRLSSLRASRYNLDHVGIGFDPERCEFFDAIAPELCRTSRTRTRTYVRLVLLNSAKSVNTTSTSRLIIYTMKAVTSQRVTMTNLKYRWGFWTRGSNGEALEIRYVDRTYSFDDPDGLLKLYHAVCYHSNEDFLNRQFMRNSRMDPDGSGCWIHLQINKLPNGVESLKHFAVELELEVIHEGFKEDDRLLKDWCDCGIGRDDGGQIELTDGRKYQKYRVDGGYHEFVKDPPGASAIPANEIRWRCWTTPFKDASHGRADRPDDHRTWHVVKKKHLYNDGESLIDRTFGFTAQAMRKDVAACHSRSGRIFWEFE